jgi:LysR family transcriptional regulator for metE and metH
LILVATIVDSGTVTRASERLGLSQSALSHQLRHLEERLGVDVFTRRGRRLSLTSAGHTLLTLAREILPRLSDTEQLIRKSPEPEVIRLATECYTGYHWLPALLRRFRERHPDVELRIVAEATRDPQRALAEGELDLALCFERPLRKCWKRQHLFDDELIFVVAPDHPLANKSTFSQEALAAHPLYVYDAPERIRTKISDQLFAKGRPVPKVSRLPLTDALTELSRAGLGVALVVGWAVQKYLDEGTLVARRLSGRKLSRRWAGVYDPRAPTGGSIRVLLDELQQVTRPS